MPLGFSFAPGSDLPMNGERDGAGSGPSRLTPQQAVKILSLRVPEHAPSNAPISNALMNSPGGSAAGANGWQSLIQQLLQSFRPDAAGQPTASPGINAGPTQMPQFPAMLGPRQTPAAPAPISGAPPPPRVRPGDAGPQAPALPLPTAQPAMPTPPESEAPLSEMQREMMRLGMPQGFTF